MFFIISAPYTHFPMAIYKTTDKSNYQFEVTPPTRRGYIWSTRWIFRALYRCCVFSIDFRLWWILSKKILTSNLQIPSVHELRYFGWRHYCHWYTERFCLSDQHLRRSVDRELFAAMKHRLTLENETFLSIFFSQKISTHLKCNSFAWLDGRKSI